MKTEPEEFSIEDLRDAPEGIAPWDGVRNFQARNFLRDEIQVGEGVLIYHSGGRSSHPGIAGEAVVARAGYPDESAWNPKSEYFDPKSSPENPIWFRVDVRFVRSCATFITLEKLRAIPALKHMMALRRGCRLSVQPVTPVEWTVILKLSEFHPGSHRD